MLARGSDLQSRTLVTESGLSGVVVEATFSVTVQYLEWIVVRQPAVIVRIDEGITFFVRYLLACCQANAAIHDVEDDMFAVKHKIELTFITELTRKAHRWECRVSWSLPCSAFATCIAYLLDHVQPDTIQTYPLQYHAHLRLLGMKPSKVEFPELFLDYMRLVAAQVLEAHLDVEARPVR